MAAVSFSTTSSIYTPAVKYDLISHSSSKSTPSSPNTNYSFGATSSTHSLRKSILQQRLPLGPPLRQQTLLHQIHHTHSHKKTHSTQLAGKLEDIMSSPLLIAPLATLNETTATTPAKDYVYTAPCEHHPSKGQTDYLVNDMFPKLTHALSTIEFGIRIADFMPLAFKTVPVVGLVEKELQLLHGLGDLPNVIHLQDSFVNDNGDTVLVLPMLKKFDCQAVNSSLCTVRKSIQQILTGLTAVHAKNIVHLDINPSNLMTTHDKKDIVIIDFGLSMTVDRSGLTTKVPVCGTSGYIAPEVTHPSYYERHDPTMADLYSLGIVLGQMLEPYIPDCDLHYFGSKYLSVENTNQTVAYLKDFIAQGSACYPRVLIEAADLLRTMLEENPNDRKSAKELLESHPFLQAPTSSTLSSATLKLCDWLCRVQEIKYQKYLYQEQAGYEVCRYR